MGPSASRWGVGGGFLDWCHDMIVSNEILMLEDSATDAELTRRAFRRANIANLLTVVASGAEAMNYLLGAGSYAKLGAAQPQLILLDLNLPQMSGIEFLRRIKGDERTRDIPVIILSLSERDRDIMAGVRLGAAGHIVKPLDFENLVRVLAPLQLHLTMVPPHPAPGGSAMRGGGTN